MGATFDRESLQQLPEQDRRKLMRELVGIERASAATPRGGWRWDLMLVGLVAGCVVLAAWIVILALTLPRHQITGSWRGAWVGFDIGLLATFAVTSWAAWRRRQLLIISLIVLATLLICDAWFDVMLDVHTNQSRASIGSALLIELPLAVTAVLVARRLLHLTILQVMRSEGETGPEPPLWQIPLFGPEAGTPVGRLMRARAKYRAEQAVEAEEAAEAERGAAERNDGPSG